MAKFTGHTITPDSALGGIEIENSLRFDEDDNTYLSASPTFNTKKYTFSFWFKPSKKGGCTFLGYNSVGNNRQTFSYGDYEGHFANQLRKGGSTQSQYATTAAHRDFGGWYHVVYVWDTDNGTQADRFIVYVNNVRKDMTQYTGTSSGVTGYIGDGNTLHIGRSIDGYSKARMYLADYHLIDGQAYDASYFGFTDALTGKWRPKKYTGSYGSGGFHLEFKDSSNLGKDTSGNANNWTANNFSVSAGAGKDLVTDTPTNNFPVLNLMDRGSVTLTQGNLKATQSSAHETVLATMTIPSGKWYWEVTCGNSNQSGELAGIGNNSGGILNSHVGSTATSWGYETTGLIWNNNNGTGSNATLTTGDILGIAYDADAGVISYYKNNSLQPNKHTGITANNYSPMVSLYHSSAFWTINFGQQGFNYTPPTGYRALNSKNRATPAAAEIINPKKHFDTLLYTGNNTDDTNITGLEFKPDFVWIKQRAGTNNHLLINSVQRRLTANTFLNSNTNGGDATDPNLLQSFNKDGFQIGTSSELNENSETYVAWCWKGGGSSNTFNVDGTGYATASAAGITDGSIALTGASVNTEAGFSIVSYVGTNANGATIAHGLGKVPKMFMIKRRDSGSSNWMVYHEVLGNTHNLYLNTNDYKQDDNHAFNDTSPTSSVITLGISGFLNASSGVYIAYCWAEIPGYSKISTYTGNGEDDDDGVYVDCGFKPAWILIKRSDSGDTKSWRIVDIVRNPNNINNTMGRIYPDLTEAEYTSAGGTTVDFLSHGFKHREATHDNVSGATYIFMAFADQPSETKFGLDANAH